MFLNLLTKEQEECNFLFEHVNTALTFKYDSLWKQSYPQENLDVSTELSLQFHSKGL
jgi:hypothetical protein